ncbi:hypothetical protein [Citreimonas salinaria]|uniref:Transcriptional regulator n=1 Tax=Citreimonas salinaria TaxID=321339 RepID=A0A1H3KSA4_9RHOB|nr:hypothetical protein [Citreimonas salinaria]SDY54896.1 hypothetical protein SAMN05444340_11072 [Citreimonas salinaria]
MSALDTARDAHGVDLPDWIEALARECDRTSQNRAAQTIGYTAGAVSAVLRGKYAAGTKSIETSVRGTLMAETVECPVLGEIGKQVCLKWRRRSRDFRNGNSMDVTMFRACARCPRNSEDG